MAEKINSYKCVVCFSNSCALLKEKFVPSLNINFSVPVCNNYNCQQTLDNDRSIDYIKLNAKLNHVIKIN